MKYDKYKTFRDPNIPPEKKIADKKKTLALLLVHFTARVDIKTCLIN